MCGQAQVKPVVVVVKPLRARVRLSTGLCTILVGAELEIVERRCWGVTVVSPKFPCTEYDVRPDDFDNATRPKL